MLLYIAAEKRMVASSELSEKVGVDKKYLYIVGRKLKEAGIVNVAMGPFGGYSLIKQPESVSIYDITKIFDDTVHLSQLRGLPDQAVLAADNFYCYIEDHANKLLSANTLVALLKKGSESD